MSDLSLLQRGRARRVEREARARRERRRRRTRDTTLVVLLGGAALLGLMASAASDPRLVLHRAPAVRAAAPVAAAQRVSRHGYGASLAPAAERVEVRLLKPLRSGLLFDVRTGGVLWRRHPGDVLAIASLTKMMTALVVAERSAPDEPVLITRAAVDYSGSGVGLLPLHKLVALETLLYGLLLPSGNDAAIALAQHVAGSQDRFLALMNARAHELGMHCSHFTTVSGILDRGNRSCATDLALLTRAVLGQPRLARIVATARAVLPFPIKGGKLYLYNHNPLLALHYAGTDGVKTGFTAEAGRCLVATAKRGRVWLGVVLLHSADPPDQARELLDVGFARLRAPAA